MAEASRTLKFNYSKFSRQGDIMLVAGVVLILFVMLIPVPPMVIDIMLTLSISVSLVVLVTTMFMKSPLEFSIYPSLLLVTTMMRLALNVASTRLILLHGDEGTGAAGKVIQSFGEFVVGGSYLIGIIIFIILFALNKMVIVSGTTRIAEVAARFTLDAMPGKQMAIEADLNAGLIDEKEANDRRSNIRRESDFYGAMDGAGKFIQGDVKATILIALINIVGGLIIGVFQKGMDWGTAAQTYTILTIGDGLVSIIPSIIICTSSGIIVSRAASEAKMGEEYLSQLTYHPKALKMVGIVLAIFGLIPGMPTVPFLIMATGIFILGVVSQRQKTMLVQASKEEVAEKAVRSLDTPEEVQALLPLDALELEVGYGLIPLVDEEQNGNLLSRIRSIRRQFALDMGVIIPSMHLRDNLQLKPGQYTVLIKGNEVASAEILIDHYLAMDPGDAKQRIPGVETREPAFNLPAIWIPEVQKDNAMLAGYTVVDPSTVIATHLTEIFKKYVQEFLGRQETQALLDNLAKRAPKVVDELVPGVLPLGTVQKVLQNLVREGVSIRDLLSIVECMADFGQAIKDPDQLTEYVRSRMGRTIVKSYLSTENVLPILSLAPSIEGTLQESVRQTEHGTYLAMEPGMAQKVIAQINNAMEKAYVADGQPVLLTSPVIRPHLAQLITRFIPSLPVVSQAEIPPEIKLQSLAVVGQMA